MRLRISVENECKCWARPLGRQQSPQFPRGESSPCEGPFSIRFPSRTGCFLPGPGCDLWSLSVWARSQVSIYGRSLAINGAGQALLGVLGTAILSRALCPEPDTVLSRAALLPFAPSFPLGEFPSSPSLVSFLGGRCLVHRLSPPSFPGWDPVQGGDQLTCPDLRSEFLGQILMLSGHVCC